MDRGRGRERGATLIESLGIGSGHLILASVERIAQCELNVALRTGQGETLGVIGRNQKRDDGSVLRIAGGVAFQALAGGNYGDILQHGSGLGLGAAIGRAREKYVDASPGPDESGDRDDLIDADGDRAHPGRNQRRQTGTGIFRSQLAGQDELAFGDGKNHAAAHHFRAGAVGSSGQGRGGILDGADIMLFDSGSDLNIVGSHNDIDAGLPAGRASTLQILVYEQADESAQG